MTTLSKKQAIGIKFHVRRHVVNGNLHKAQELLDRHGLTMDECKLDPEYNAPPEVTISLTPQPVLEVTSPTPQPTPTPAPTLVQGWPDRVLAEVVHRPLNRRLLLIQLPDGREAAMWKYRNRSVGFKVTARLHEFAGGEPYYEEVL